MRIAGKYTTHCKVCGAEIKEHRFGTYCRDCFNANEREKEKKKLEALKQKAAKDTAHAISAVAAEANRRHMTYGQLVASERVAP